MDFGALFDAIGDFIKGNFNVVTGSAEGVFNNIEAFFNGTSSALGSSKK